MDYCSELNERTVLPGRTKVSVIGVSEGTIVGVYICPYSNTLYYAIQLPVPICEQQYTVQLFEERLVYPTIPLKGRRRKNA